MKTIYITLAAAAILSACTTAHRQQPTGTTRDTSIAQIDDIPEDSTMYNPGVLIINYTRTDTVRAALLAQVNQLNATVIYDYNIIDAIAVRLPEPHALSATNRAIQAQIPPRHPRRRTRPRRPPRHRQITQPKYWFNKPYTPFAILLIQKSAINSLFPNYRM